MFKQKLYPRNRTIKLISYVETYLILLIFLTYLLFSDSKNYEENK